jgi:hypothetical protein
MEDRNMKDQLKILFILVAGVIVSASPYLPANPTTTAMLAAVARKSSGGPDVTPPTLVSATINGTALVLNFSENTSQGANYSNSHLDLDMTVTGNNIAVTYVSGNGTSSWSFTAASAAVPSDVVDLDFAGGADRIEDGAGNDLAGITSAAVTNNTPGGFPTTNLVAFYKLDEASGNALDSFGTAQDLTDSGTVGTVENTIGGYTGNVRTFDGSTQYFRDGEDDPVFDTGVANFSVSGWAYLSSTGSANALRCAVAKRQNLTNANEGYGFGFERSTGTNVRTNADSGVSAADTEVNFTDNLTVGTVDTWFHFVVVVDRAAETMVLYVDGDTMTPVETVSTVAFSTSASMNNDQEFAIGALSGTAQKWLGRLSHVGFWTKALSSSEIESVYNSGTPVGP